MFRRSGGFHVFDPFEAWPGDPSLAPFGFEHRAERPDDTRDAAPLIRTLRPIFFHPNCRSANRAWGRYAKRLRRGASMLPAMARTLASSQRAK